MIDETWAKKTLKSSGVPDEILGHCEAVRDACAAFLILLRKKNPSVRFNRNLVLAGALLHDIGRSKTQGIGHAVAGAEIIRALNTGNDPDMEKLALICERHIGAGIPRKDAVKLGLPDKDFIPRSIEEMIVAYCDNMVDEEGGKSIIKGPAWAAEHYAERHGEDSEPARRVRELNRFFEDLLSRERS